MKRTALILCLAVAAVAGGPGLRPHPDAGSYPVHKDGDGFSIGARCLSADEVKKTFATDLNKGGYVVVEVALYPKDGQTLSVAPGDFSLRVGGTDMVRPANAQAVAASLTRPAQDSRGLGRNVNVYPSATVGYENGTDPYGRRRSGVYTATGVGVGVGSPGNGPMPSQGSGRDRRTMEQELEDQSLPDGDISRPAAGYLYFPVSQGKRKTAALDLDFYTGSADVRLALPR